MRKLPLCIVFTLVLFVSLATTAPCLGDDFPEVVNSQAEGESPPTPEEAAASFTPPDGFEVELFAGEPDVQQPIGFSIDDRGRLWVAECYSYQGRGFTDEQRDRIVILEDTNHDGQFDRRKVFWDEGRQLSSVLPGFGGLYILNHGCLQFIADRDGDDVPDAAPETLLDGFDRSKVSHNIVNGLMWGPDGWLWARHGIQATSNVGKPGASDQERTQLNCAIWRYHPTRHVFDVVAEGTTNPWGLDYDEHGEFFFTNNVIGHLWHVIPGARYERMYGQHFNPFLYRLMPQTADHYHWDNSQKWTASREAMGKHDELGGGHSHCGGMIYLGGNWPDEYRGRIFMCNTHGRRVNQNILERQGSGYVGRRAPDILFANQPWFRGVELKYGPDGGVYLTDWVDKGECHDHDGVHRTSGRIYKITYGKSDAPKVDDVSKLSGAELVELHRDKNHWYSRHARRVLHERHADGKDLSDAAKALEKLLDDEGDVPLRLRALWSLYVIERLDRKTLIDLLEDENEHVRSWAIRLLLDDGEASDEACKKFIAMSEDEQSGLVRLWLASSLGRLPHEKRWPIATNLARRTDEATDIWLKLLVWYGIEPAVTSDPKQALALLKATPHAELRQFITRRLAEGD